MPLLRPRLDKKAAERIDSWFCGKDFSTDWTSGNFAVWSKYLRPLQDRTVNILEIGSWEGRSALFFLHYLPMSTITCVDSFEGSKFLRSHPRYREEIAQVETRFDYNLSALKGRVRKIKSYSLPALIALADANDRFDLVYIDGSHTTDDVMTDSILSWRLLSFGGLMIWDDYRLAGPRPAIKAFVAMHRNELARLHRGYQLIVRKLEPRQRRGNSYRR